MSGSAVRHLVEEATKSGDCPAVAGQRRGNASLPQQYQGVAFNPEVPNGPVALDLVETGERLIQVRFHIGFEKAQSVVIKYTPILLDADDIERHVFAAHRRSHEEDPAEILRPRQEDRNSQVNFDHIVLE